MSMLYSATTGDLTAIRRFKCQVIHIRFFGSGALSGKMLLVRIVENNKIEAYFRSGWVLAHRRG